MPTIVHSNLARAGAHRAVPIDLPGREYEILIGAGLLDDTGRLIAQRLGKGKCGIVTDANVAAHHLATLEAALKSEGRHKGSIVMPAGETTKSFRKLAELSETLLEMGLERGDLVIAFGGGVIGDLAGFAASILRRGVRYVQIPTSLLAQVDSSVGGKTGINTAQGKNLIGTFHQPSLVLADTDVLTTLPGREMRSGYAEVAKYGLLGDAEFFAWLEGNWQAIFALDPAAMTSAIETSVRAKAAIVLADEKEAGVRGLLNLGHTFGHALEAATGYGGRLLHGEGVSIGMVLALELSERLGLTGHGTAGRAANHLSAVGLPTSITEIAGPPLNADELVHLMGQDKKVRDGRMTFVLVRGIGDAFLTQDVDIEVVRAMLAEKCTPAT
ncbi:MAG: 3-dehydroquinate synthase [Alphaproteobacteria bacterium BRH_c36]|nr:MAG: 3-dehydroquinate synthase [Alphaproteobacteria bacterium BRH_c36]